MAKIVIAGDAVVVTSSIKLEDYRKVEKYRPEALTLMGGEDGKEPIFRVATTNAVSGASLGKYGAEFASATRDDDKLATITMFYGGIGGANIKEKIADELGVAILNLNKLEETIPDVIAEIDAQKAAIMENITIAQ